MRTAAACRRQRAVLVDLVDRGERGPATAAALDHLSGCRPCEHDLTELALTIAALRRAGVAYRALPVPMVAPPAPVARPAPTVPVRRRSAWAWRLQLGSLVTCAGLAAMLVAPRVGLLPARPAADAAAPPRPAATAAWQAAEHRLASSPDVAPVAAIGSLPPRYPEGLSRPWKEVPPADAAAREPEPQ